jgi:phosphohistidine swiveling domain-containing protein
MTDLAEGSALAVSLSSISRWDLASVGGKAANLGELLKAGFSVPEGFVIRSEAFDEAGRLTSGAHHQLAAALDALGGGEVAVRSSAVSEDMPDASFAGQYETVLGVKGPHAVMAAVERCRASGGSARVRAYQTVKGVDAAPMAVLVQRMVAAESAGVAFTANPVSGDRQETLVSAVRGLGERLVAGLASPDEWSIQGGRAVSRTRPEQAITCEQALLVADLARRVEAHFETPQDIEWAFAGDRLFLLQARPITTLNAQAVEPPAERLEVPAGFWERDATHFPEPCSPSFRFVFQHLTQVSRELVSDFGLPIEEISQREIGGWLYLRLAPLGGKERKPPPTWLARLMLPVMFRFVPGLRASATAAERFFASDRAGDLVESWYREWRPAAAAGIDRLQACDLGAFDDDALEQHLASTLDFSREGWRRHFLLHLPDLLLPAELIFFCRDELGWEDSDTLQILYGLSSKTTEPAHRLAELASLARSLPAVQRLLESGQATLAALESIDPEFAAALHGYQRSYGCRGLRYEPAEKTVGECPDLLLGLIRDQLERGYDPAVEAKAQRRFRETALRRGRQALAQRPEALRERFEHLVERAQRAYPVREDNEFYLVSAPLALLRYALLEIGRRLADRGQIGRTEDVFFLDIDETPAALRGGGDQTALIERRKGERAWVKAHPGPNHYGERPEAPPSLVGLPPATARLMRFLLWAVGNALGSADSAQRHSPDAVRLTGVAGSAGTYQGPVRVITSEAEFGKIRAGDVLVCPITSPVWSVIFPSVGALVTDAGGILAHAALIAREYRVPAVLATGNGTEILHDGQMVTVDGTAGIVTIEA